MCKGLYPLFLAGNKCLEPRCHSKTKLINEGRLILAVDLNFNPSFKRCLICQRDKRVCEHRNNPGKVISLMNSETWKSFVSEFHTEALNPHTSTELLHKSAHIHR